MSMLFILVFERALLLLAALPSARLLRMSRF